MQRRLQSIAITCMFLGFALFVSAFVHRFIGAVNIWAAVGALLTVWGLASFFIIDIWVERN